MLPRMVTVWIPNSWDSWQRYGMKGTQGASLLCPSWGWSAMAASQEAWKMCQHLLGGWWTCCLTGLHFPWVWSSVAWSEVLASSWQMFPLMSLIEQTLWEHLYQPTHMRTQPLCTVQLSLLDPDWLQVSVPPGQWHNFKLCFLFAKTEDVFLRKGHASDVVLNSLTLWICHLSTNFFSNKWFILDV